MAKRGTTAGIDLAELERLCMMQCTDEEIAAWFGVTTRTIERRRKNPKFAEVMNRGKAKGRISVRRQQLKLLEAGNATMGVWLGKQILGQTDYIDHQIHGAHHIVVCMPRALDQQAELQAKEFSPSLRFASPLEIEASSIPVDTEEDA